MARSRTTFGKMQRDRDKQAKAQAKQDKRAARAEQRDDETAPAAPVDQGKVLAALAALHEAYDDGRVSLEDFEEQRDELRASLQVE